MTVLRRTAEKLGIKLQPQVVNDPDQLESAFGTIAVSYTHLTLPTN